MITEITSLLRQQHYPAALAQFLILLGQIINNEFDLTAEDISVVRRMNSSLHSDDESPAQAVFTSLCHLFEQILLQESVKLNQAQFDFLIKHKSYLMDLYEGSDYYGTDRILDQLLPEQNVVGLDKNDPRLGKFLVLYPLYSTHDVDFGPLLKKNPSLAVPALLELCAKPYLLDVQAREKQQQLLQILPQITSYSVKDTWLDSINYLWMYCTYLESGAQHWIKKQLNSMMQKWLKKNRVSVPALAVREKLKKKPVILVAAEYFTNKHALYRCFAPSIAQLREHFTLILMVKSDLVNEAGRQLFDRVVEIEFEENTIRKLVGQVIKLKPDMIYYPSLGMDIWTLLLANLRLAPIQFMTSGHPATSHSPFIDYYLLPDNYFSGNEQLFSEQLILLDYHSHFQMIAPHNLTRPATLIRFNPEVTKIAVPVNQIKLTTRLMQVCQQIEQQTLKEGQRKIEFHFFPYAQDYQFSSLKQKIQQWLPNAIVYPAKPFEQYLIDFNQCDIQLNGFPFDGTNSCADAILQCIPFVTLQGEEPFSRLGIRFIKETSLPDWLLVDSIEAYIEAALRLIHNDTERFNISRDLKAVDFNERFLDSDYVHHEPVFGQAVKWLYENHRAIQADDRKVWKFNQLDTFRDAGLS